MNRLRLKVSITRLLGLSLLLTLTGIAAQPPSGLDSLSQEARDAAAEIARQSFVPPARTNWDALLSRLKLGLSRTNAIEILGPHARQPEGGGGTGSTEWQRFRLDALWQVECAFSSGTSNQVLLQRKLIQQMRDVWITPPTNFTGVWKTYWANGYPSCEIHCLNGRYQGEFVSLYPEGSKACVQHYTNGVAEGGDTGFYRSGRTNYTGQYKAGSQAGHWVWYKEDGSVESERDYGPK